MSNDYSRQSSNLPVSDSVEEWLSHQAEKEDISREQLFGQLVSSYWTLNEMEELLGSSSEEELSVAQPSDDGSAEANEEMRERLAKVEEKMETEVERRQSLDMLAEMTAGRLTDVEETLDELAGEVEEVRESVDRKHESVAERADELEEELEQERETRASEQQMLAGEQDRIGSRLDSEFENLETILTYLVSRTDELEAGVSDIDSRQEEALTRLRRERDALNSIKREAADANVQSGECESCGETIDIGMLSQPYCPACEKMLTGVEEEQKWLFFSDIVVTTESESQKRSGRDGIQPFRETGRSQSAGGEHSSGGPGDSGSDRSVSQSREEPAGTRQGSEPSTTVPDPDPDRASRDSEVSGSTDADDTGWADSGFEHSVISEESAGDVSERHSRAEAPSPASAGQNGGQSGAQPADGGDEPEATGGGERNGDGSDNVESPFGDLGDLTDEE